MLLLINLQDGQPSEFLCTPSQFGDFEDVDLEQKYLAIIHQKLHNYQHEHGPCIPQN